MNTSRLPPSTPLGFAASVLILVVFWMCQARHCELKPIISTLSKSYGRLIRRQAPSHAGYNARHSSLRSLQPRHSLQNEHVAPRRCNMHGCCSSSSCCCGATAEFQVHIL
eukprot:4732072-Amphidinium_carterae.1